MPKSKLENERERTEAKTLVAPTHSARWRGGRRREELWEGAGRALEAGRDGLLQAFSMAEEEEEEDE